MQRVGLLNGENITYDHDLSAGIVSSLLPGVIEGGNISGVNIEPIKALVQCTRANGQKVMVFFESDANVDVQANVGTKKIFILIDQAKIDDGTGNAEDGTGIGEITTDTNYPSDNYIPLYTITLGVSANNRLAVRSKATRSGLTPDRLSYIDANGDEQFFAFGALGTVLTGKGVGTPPVFELPSIPIGSQAEETTTQDSDFFVFERGGLNKKIQYGNFKPGSVPAKLGESITAGQPVKWYDDAGVLRARLIQAMKDLGRTTFSTSDSTLQSTPYFDIAFRSETEFVTISRNSTVTVTVNRWTISGDTITLQNSAQVTTGAYTVAWAVAIEYNPVDDRFAFMYEKESGGNINLYGKCGYLDGSDNFVFFSEQNFGAYTDTAWDHHAMTSLYDSEHKAIVLVVDDRTAIFEIWASSLTLKDVISLWSIDDWDVLGRITKLGSNEYVFSFTEGTGSFSHKLTFMTYNGTTLITERNTITLWSNDSDVQNTAVISYDEKRGLWVAVFSIYNATNDGTEGLYIAYGTNTATVISTTDAYRVSDFESSTTGGDLTYNPDADTFYGEVSLLSFTLAFRNWKYKIYEERSSSQQVDYHYTRKIAYNATAKKFVSIGAKSNTAGVKIANGANIVQMDAINLVTGVLDDIVGTGIKGSLLGVYTSLTPSLEYFIDPETLVISTTPSNFSLGRAISTTTIINELDPE